ncbi:MAG: ATP-binding protein [Kangiellaceae bacterium]|jgi:signal transduction histidine kinase|nr:ATP-binding protein [Kangiellaceae bacterium]
MSWTLRRKFLIFAVLLLGIPFFGVSFIKQLEHLLTESLLENLSSYATSLAINLQQSEAFEEQSKPILRKQRFYVTNHSAPITVDGYLDDWFTLRSFSETFQQNDIKFTVTALSHGGFIYFSIAVEDDSLNYRNVADSFSVSDQVKLELFQNDQPIAVLQFAPVAVGSITPFVATVDSYKVWVNQANWQESENGYQLELKMPDLSLFNGIRVVVENYDNRTQQLTSALTDPELPHQLQRPNKDIESFLANLQLKAAQRVWVLDTHGNVMARRGSIDGATQAKPVNPLIHFLLAPPTDTISDPRQRAVNISLPVVNNALAGKSSQRIESINDSAQSVALVSVPILANRPAAQTARENMSTLASSAESFQQTSAQAVVGVVLLEESVASVQIVQRQAMNVFINATLLAMLSVVVILIVFASRFVARLLRLKNATVSAIDELGRINYVIEAETNSDELGELSRTVAIMTKRLKDYHDYMEKLSARLSHELRTPIAMVGSSLDQIITNDLTTKKAVENARVGIRRMSQLISRMREAARLEQAILNVNTEHVDLVAFCNQYLSSFSSLHSNHRMKLEVIGRAQPIESSTELLAQLLDKLLSNALDFAFADSPIEVLIEFAKDQCTLAVVNVGPELPDIAESDLFASMTSYRDSSNRSEDQSHMGLGLYVVKLIADFHKGRCIARNLSNKQVLVGISVPYELD